MIGDNQERRIIIIGKVGAGKSAIGNAILGQKVFKSKQSFCSVTQECCVEDVIRNNRRFIVCDTPGANGLLEDRENFMNHLKRCLYVTSPGFHVILFVISAGQRIEQSDVNMFKEYEKLLGDQAYTYSIIAFTRVEPDECEGLIRDSKEISELRRKCGDRVLSFGNQQEIRKDLVKTFEEMVEILVSKNQSLPFYQHEAYTEAFKIICEDAKELKRKNKNLSDVDSITGARKAAFEGRSPRDKSLIKLMNMEKCCVIL